MIQINDENENSAQTDVKSIVPPKPKNHPSGSAPLPVGRPSKINWLQVKEICQRIQKGEFLTDILKTEGMPEVHTFMRWCDKYSKLAQWVERSRKVAADVLAEKSVTLFFEEPVTETLKTKNGSYERISMSGVQRERYKSQAMQWLATKWKPDTYGDKLNVQQTFDLSLVLNSVDTRPKELKQAKSA
ncbi:MAG: hypothetical protein KGL39_19805 [Patescibacteria group bacterium]|nr:hypothetical protein [Patescibacteria group bacterium]